MSAHPAHKRYPVIAVLWVIAVVLAALVVYNLVVSRGGPLGIWPELAGIGFTAFEALHRHLIRKDGRLRWYLLAGEIACIAAVCGVAVQAAWRAAVLPTDHRLLWEVVVVLEIGAAWAWARWTVWRFVRLQRSWPGGDAAGST